MKSDKKADEYRKGEETRTEYSEGEGYTVRRGQINESG